MLHTDTEMLSETDDGVQPSSSKNRDIDASGDEQDDGTEATSANSSLGDDDSCDVSDVDDNGGVETTFSRTLNSKKMIVAGRRRNARVSYGSSTAFPTTEGKDESGPAATSVLESLCNMHDEDTRTDSVKNRNSLFHGLDDNEDDDDASEDLALTYAVSDHEMDEDAAESPCSLPLRQDSEEMYGSEALVLDSSQALVFDASQTQDDEGMEHPNDAMKEVDDLADNIDEEEEEEEYENEKSMNITAESLEDLDQLTEELIHAVDRLYSTVDRDVVTVKTFHKSLEENLGAKLPKNVKALVKERLLGLLTGNIKRSSNVTSDNDDSSVASSSSDEEDGASESEAELSHGSEGEWEEEEKKKTKKRNVKSKKSSKSSENVSKQRSPPKSTRLTRMKAKKKRPSPLLDKQLKTIRQKQAEEAQVRSEELAGIEEKVHADDLRRQEGIAARFDNGQEETKILREQDRRGLLEKLMLKKRRVFSLTDEDLKPKVKSEHREDVGTSVGALNESVTAESKQDLTDRFPSEESTEHTHEGKPDIISDRDAKHEVVVTASSSSVAGTSDESDADSDSDLEIMQETKEFLSNKASPSNIADLILDSKSFTASNSSNRKNDIVVRSMSSTGAKRRTTTNLNARAALRNSLRSKAINASNTWASKVSIFLKVQRFTSLS